jgi:hypothetical protein
MLGCWFADTTVLKIIICPMVLGIYPPVTRTSVHQGGMKGEDARAFRNNINALGIDE